MFMKSINVEGGYSFCGGWNFSKLVSVDPTFIREMRVYTYMACWRLFERKDYFSYTSTKWEPFQITIMINSCI